MPSMEALAEAISSLMSDGPTIASPPAAGWSEERVALGLGGRERALSSPMSSEEAAKEVKFRLFAQLLVYKSYRPNVSAVCESVISPSQVSDYISI